jgi:hypothetical protein
MVGNLLNILINILDGSDRQDPQQDPQPHRRHRFVDDEPFGRQAADDVDRLSRWRERT